MKRAIVWIFHQQQRCLARQKEIIGSVTSKKSQNVYKSCPKMIYLKKLTKNVGDFGKIIVATGFEKLPNLVTLIIGWSFL